MAVYYILVADGHSIDFSFSVKMQNRNGYHKIRYCGGIFSSLWNGTCLSLVLVLLAYCQDQEPVYVKEFARPLLNMPPIESDQDYALSLGQNARNGLDRQYWCDSTVRSCSSSLGWKNNIMNLSYFIGQL